MGAIVGQAVRDPSFILIFLGFFSCGYQLGFITAHFPAFVTEVYYTNSGGRGARRASGSPRPRRWARWRWR